MGVRSLHDSVRLGGEEGWSMKGTDKGSFDDVTSFILRRHQKNLCLSLLKIYGPSSSLLSLRPPPPLKGSPPLDSPTNGAGWYATLLTVKNKGGESVIFLKFNMKWKYLGFDFQKRLPPLKPSNALFFFFFLYIEGFETSSVGTSWSAASIKWISHCLLTHGGHNSPWWVHCLSHFKMNWIWSPREPAALPHPCCAYHGTFVKPHRHWHVK